MTYKDRLSVDKGPRRLLALDGGGIRGLISLGVLEKVESIVRGKLANPQAVLADYFDYIAGTSTGGIIATCLSLGMSVGRVKQFYRDHGKGMFSRAGLLKRYYHKFEDENLSAQLKQEFGAETTLGSDRLRTLLMLVMRNATTDSPWPVSNNPDAKYNDRSRPDCNLNLPLWQLVRASTAAPTYFPPESVSIGSHNFIFVDGGVTMYNNPAFQMFLMSTAEPYNLRWRTGADKMLIVSVGTGFSPSANANLHPGDMNLIYNATEIPAALMFAAMNEQDLLCRVFGECLAGLPIDREVGDLIGGGIPEAPKLFTYLRYNGELSREGLKQLGLAGIEPAQVQALDSVDHMDELEAVGSAIAVHQVKVGDFGRF